MSEVLFSKSGLSLVRLKTLCQIGQYGEIGRAAERTGSKQSQFSKQLKELEQFFGMALVDRRKKALTTPGKRIVDLAEPFLNALDGLYRELAGLQRTISFGAGEAIIEWIFFPKLQSLHAAFPHVSWTVTNLTSPEIRDSILDNALDFGVLRKESCSREPLLEIKDIGDMDFALFIPRSLQSKRSIPTATLRGSDQFTPQFEQIARAQNPPLEIRVACESFPAVRALVSSGNFAGMLPVLACSELTSANFKIVHHPAFQKLTRHYVLAVNKKNLASRPEMERVWHTLVATCRF